MKVFSDKRFLPRGEEHVVMLYPFWGKPQEHEGDPWSGRFDRYVATGGSAFKMASLEDADVAVLPAPWERIETDPSSVQLAEEFAEFVSQANKPTAVFYWSDSDRKVPIENPIVFRTSLFRSRRTANEFAMPAWSEDLLQRYFGGQLQVRHKSAKPVVGFCGFSAPLKAPLWGKLSQEVQRLLIARFMSRRDSIANPRSGHYLRAKALKALLNHPLVRTNFVIRDRFYAGVSLLEGDQALRRARTVRREYVDNLIESDYVLCTRGAGNFSYRLYETLCCGRIPLFIDTDCVLPYDFAINWNSYLALTNERDVGKIGEKITEFHENLSPQDYVDLQHECRDLWERWISPEGFLSNFHLHFRMKDHSR